MCHAYNEWARETFADYGDVLVSMAAIAPGDVDVAIAETQRCADLGFKGLALPCKPKFGPPDHNDLNYNLREFDPLWVAICEVDLPVTFHVSTGRYPRTSRSRGGAVINYAVHSLAPTMEPIANICASGVAEQFPNLRFGTVGGEHRLGRVGAPGDG
jgi:predicted TIM-barrel fold metal-dependent hydrolase